MDIKITPGAIFDTSYETGCVALEEPDEDGHFEARDSGNVVCEFSLPMVSKVYEAAENA